MNTYIITMKSGVQLSAKSSNNLVQFFASSFEGSGLLESVENGIVVSVIRIQEIAGITLVTS